MNRLKQFLAAATLSAGLLAQAAVIPAAIAPPVLAAAPAATEQAVQAPQAKGKLIFIDAGHGGSDVGAVHEANGQVDIKERDMTLDTAQRLARMLREAGYDVQMSRSDSGALVDGSQAADLRARVDAANKCNADLLISVHYNAAENKNARGTEVWYCGDRSNADQNKALATEVQKALVANLGQAGYETKDQGIKDDAAMGHFAITGPNLERPSKMPSIIGEALYVTNEQDAARLQQPEVREAIARGYFQGIEAYFGRAQS